ncbi:MAG: DNA topoisomerase III [Deltaproteobacteria bacterium]|nr:DNA topoisomerase III [Deltaproteobacteria bacterium]
MGKALIIAEKPSVAADVARALGGFKRHQDYYESDDYVLSSAVGHLLEQTPPEGVEAKKGKWSFANLPVIPPYFDLKPIQKNASRLKTLVKLIKRRDVDALVNACDAGREGELIFRNIVRHAKAKKPVKRLWLQSMTPAAIRNGFVELREDEDMQPLADAALSRSEADWLVGINGTRAMTAFNSKPGGFYKTTVGRVQTPTLAIVAEREAAIRDFRPEPYWEVTASFQAEGGEYQGRWFDEKFRKKDSEPHARPERIWEEAAAEAIRDRCLGQAGSATEESKPTRQAPPPLFDLTSLQREANARFGLSANRTVQIAQALYERHKVLTYPRTDSRALPEDYVGTVKDSLRMLKDTSYAPFADNILEQDWVKPNKRIFNNAKVSDHFAIIPTTEAPKRLNDIEQRIYDLVTRRFLAIFYPAAEYLETTRITRVEGEPFRTNGKVLVKAGWLEVHGRDNAQKGEEPTLAPLRAVSADAGAADGVSRDVPGNGGAAGADPTGATAGAVPVDTTGVEVKQNQTRPPARFTEATLLGAMEGAGRLVTDEDLRAAMAGKGLGTSATRASIIEGLIDEDYIVRDGKELQATPKAFMLMELLNGLGVRELTKPELTGNWEYQLFQMQGGKKSRDEFMGEIAEMTRQIVDRARQYEHDTIPGDFGSLAAPCPKCEGEVHERYRNYQCANCEFSLPKILAGRLLSTEEIETLIGKGQIGPLQGFRSRQGRPFAAVLNLSPEHKIAFDFGNDTRNGAGEGEPQADFSDQEPLGKCSRCVGRVFELPMRYVCENAVGDTRTCEFSSGKIILRQEVPREQMMKLLAEGRTDLLTGFVSARTGRSFKAFLVIKDDKVGFEFEPRPPRKTAGTAADKPAAKADFSGQEPVGKCPRCGGRVFEWQSQYLCEKSQADQKPCRFKSGTVILEQPVDRVQMAKLLTDGKTDLLPEFVSSKSGRQFAAWLVLDDKGKVGFEFPPRE